jgi:hypothetical protein
VKRLFAFGSTEAYFYKWGGDRGWTPHITSYVALSDAFRLLWLGVCILGGLCVVVRYPNFPPEKVAEDVVFRLGVSFLGVFVVAMLMLGEVAQRYMFPVYFVGPLLLAAVLHRSAGPSAAGRARVRHAGVAIGYVAGSVAVVVVTYAAASVLAGRRVEYPGRKYVALPGRVTQSRPPAAEVFEPIGPYGHQIVYEGEQVVAYKFCEPSLPDRAQIELYLGHREQTPKLGSQPSVVENCVLKTDDGEERCVKDGFYSIASTKAHGCHVVELHLTSERQQGSRWSGLFSLKSR